MQKPTMTPKHVLKVNQLSTYLQIQQHQLRVVENLSFCLEPGKTLAIVGESGCGKTMTALSIMRILTKPPLLRIEGEVLYQDKNLLSLSEEEMRKIRGGHLAMIFQDPTSALNPVYRIGDQLLEMASLHLNLHGDEAIELVVKALSDVGISAARDRLYEYPHQLSGGMRQRIMIAMALLCEPAILIADEPTTALDVTIQAQILELIRELQTRKGMAMLLITHDMGVVAEMADDVIVMYASQAVERGSIDEIFDHPSHPYTQGLFQSRPSIEGRKERLTPIKGSVPPITRYPEGCRFHPRCKYMMSKCCSGNVPDFIINDDVAHQAKCWLHDGSEESAIKKGL